MTNEWYITENQRLWSEAMERLSKSNPLEEWGIIAFINLLNTEYRKLKEVANAR